LARPESYRAMQRTRRAGRDAEQTNLWVVSKSAAATGIIFGVYALMTLYTPRTAPRRTCTSCTAAYTHTYV